MIPPPPPKTAVAAFVLALIIAALLTPDLRQFAERHGLLDKPDQSRKIHRRGIPRIGGLAIAAAFYAPLVGLLLYETGLGELFYANRWAAFSLFGGGVAIAALGLYDDLRGLGAREKFAVEFAVAAVLYFCGYRIEQISLPGGALELGAAAFPLTLIWVVGVINAMNLIDGLDGLAGGVALCAILTNLIVAVVRAEPIMILCMAALAGALIGFLFYNFNPASIFMGDSGSLFLGFVLAVSSIRTNQKSSTAVSLLGPVVGAGRPHRRHGAGDGAPDAGRPLDVPRRRRAHPPPVVEARALAASSGAHPVRHVVSAGRRGAGAGVRDQSLDGVGPRRPLGVRFLRAAVAGLLPARARPAGAAPSQPRAAYDRECRRGPAARGGIGGRRARIGQDLCLRGVGGFAAAGSGAGAGGAKLRSEGRLDEPGTLGVQRTCARRAGALPGALRSARPTRQPGAGMD